MAASGVSIGLACGVTDVDLTGRKCPCIDGFVCVSGICLRPGTVTDGPVAEASEAGCVPRGAPPRPTGVTDEPRLTFLTALRRMDLRPPANFDSPYFDLDGVCTCPGAGSCVGPTRPDSGAPTDVCDEADGVDRSLNDVLGGFLQNKDLTTVLAAGKLGIIFRVREYNGGAEDGLVKVDYLFSGGLEGSQDGGDLTPRFDGTDVYTVLPSSIKGDNSEAQLTADGYVTGGMLVAALGQTARVEGQFSLLITQSLLVAKIEEKDGKRWVSQGTWSGRVEAVPLLTGLANFTLLAEPLCKDPASFDLIKVPICNGRDVTTVVPSPPGLPCDALSIAGAIEGAPIAGLGGKFERPPLPQPCGADFKASCD